jgi:lipopolysaccharide/colanic/teichoic acid biosynthesis glycosyltransferase
MITPTVAEHVQRLEQATLLREWAPAPPHGRWVDDTSWLDCIFCGPRYAPLKRAMDIAAAAALLLPALAVLAVCAAALWCESPGPVFFRQWRTGRFGQRFRMLKLRTMVTNAEELKATYGHLNVLRPPDFKIPNDPRMTRVGRFLRRTSLDELPQLFNILRGEMSFVGPRPTSFVPESYSPWEWERLAVPPGLTGLWQVSGRSEVDFVERCRLDIYYVRHCTLRLDLLILLRTALAVVNGRGAA